MNSRGGVCATHSCTSRVSPFVGGHGARYVANPPATEWGMTPKDIVGGGVCGTETQISVESTWNESMSFVFIV